MKKIGIIGAMELEVETLKEHMSAANITKKANMEFYEGTLNGADVVIVRSGIGKVNAALCVQILADLFHVTAVINTGVAGSLNAKLNIGDILVSTDALHHDVDATLLAISQGKYHSLAAVNLLQMPALQSLLLLLVKRSIRTFMPLPDVC